MLAEINPEPIRKAHQKVYDIENRDIQAVLITHLTNLELDIEKINKQFTTHSIDDSFRCRIISDCCLIIRLLRIFEYIDYKPCVFYRIACICEKIPKMLNEE